MVKNDYEYFSSHCCIAQMDIGTCKDSKIIYTFNFDLKHFRKLAFYKFQCIELL